MRWRFGSFRFFLRAAFLSVLLMAPALAFAVTPEEMLRDPKQEARARELSAQLRCMVCQNESLDESEASLAADIRRLVREKIVAGESDEAIKAFLVARYGDFILLKPPFKIETLLLWAAPFLMLVIGGVAIFVAIRRRGQGPTSVLTEAETAKLAAIVDEDDI
jgi:cytochrome c-type biogenesis protein CcmH